MFTQSVQGSTGDLGSAELLGFPLLQREVPLSSSPQMRRPRHSARTTAPGHTGSDNTRTEKAELCVVQNTCPTPP